MILIFFTDHSFDQEELSRQLFAAFQNVGILRTNTTGITCAIGGVKCDFHNWAVPFIRQDETIDNIRFCSLEDVGAFKLDAIRSRKEKKDFVDIELLISIFGLEYLSHLYNEKFPYNDFRMIVEAFPEIDLADGSEEPVMIKPYSWDIVKSNIKLAFTQAMAARLENAKQAENERLRRIEELLKQRKIDGNQMPNN